MIAKPNKFQAIAVKKNCRMKNYYTLNIKKQTINSEKCLRLLGIKLYKTCSLDQLFYVLQKKTIKCGRKISEVHEL